jgi:hypothetical protein
MIIYYSQHYIAKLCNETDTSISRIVERSSIRPSFNVGLRLLYTEAEMREILGLVTEYRLRVPKIPRTQKGLFAQ